MADKPRNVGASIRARLQNLAAQKGQVFDILLTRYALERFLYRLSRSEYAGRFVLKGAMLTTIWFDEPHRPTRDLDLLGFGDSAADPMLAVFRSICAMPVRLHEKGGKEREMPVHHVLHDYLEAYVDAAGNLRRTPFGVTLISAVRRALWGGVMLFYFGLLFLAVLIAAWLNFQGGTPAALPAALMLALLALFFYVTYRFHVESWLIQRKVNRLESNAGT